MNNTLRPLEYLLTGLENFKAELGIDKADTGEGGAEAEIPDKYQHLSPADDIFVQPELDEEGNEIRVERTEERLD